MNMDARTFEAMVLGDERLRAFNNTVPAGILVLGVNDGRVLFSNRFFNEVLGVDGIAVLGESWRDLFADPSDRERLMLRFVEQGEVRNFELRLKRPDGRVVWGLASLSEIPIEDEDLLMFAFVDITALKPSRSMNSTASSVLSRRARAMASSMRSRNSRRLGRPVKAS